MNDRGEKPRRLCGRQLFISQRILVLFDPISINSDILVETESSDMIISVTNTASDLIGALITIVPRTKTSVAEDILRNTSGYRPRRYNFRACGRAQDRWSVGLRGDYLGRLIQIRPIHRNGRFAMHAVASTGGAR